MRKEFYIYGGCIMLVAFLTLFLTIDNKSKASDESGKGNSKYESDSNEDTRDNVWSKDEFLVNEDQESDVKHKAKKIDNDPTSKTVLVNKENPISQSYVPDDLVIPNVNFSFDYADEKRYMRLEAAEALEKMFAAAEYYGYELLATSGYRSYGRQTTLYNYNLVTNGYDYTNVYSAQPGTSEHQTGWSIDMTCESLNGKLSVDFGKTQEGKWVDENCYKYGFVLRYPKDKEKITAYGYEPWHFRYVGYDLAKYLYDNKLTLDEYYGYKPNESYIERNQMAYYDNILTGKKPTASNVGTAELDDIVNNMDEQIGDSSVTHEADSTPTPVITPPPVKTSTPKTHEPTTEAPKVTDKPTSQKPVQTTPPAPASTAPATVTTESPEQPPEVEPTTDPETTEPEPVG